MNLMILFQDEVHHFFKIRAMMYLWILLPVMTVFAHVFNSDTGMMSYALFMTSMTATIIGVVAGALIASSIINEKQQNVYIPFIIRPLKRRDLLLARYFAVCGSMFVTVLVAIVIGLIVDIISSGMSLNADMIHELVYGFTLCSTIIFFSGSIGLLLGVVNSSVYVALMIYLFFGLQSGNLMIYMFSWIDDYAGVSIWWHRSLLQLAIGLVLTIGTLWMSVKFFNKKQF